MEEAERALRAAKLKEEQEMIEARKKAEREERAKEIYETQRRERIEHEKKVLLGLESDLQSKQANFVKKKEEKQFVEENRRKTKELFEDTLRSNLQSRIEQKNKETKKLKALVK